jgi:hypothetical protein
MPSRVYLDRPKHLRGGGKNSVRCGFTQEGEHFIENYVSAMDKPLSDRQISDRCDSG